MSYSRNRLSTLAYANGFTLWHYKACLQLRHLHCPTALRRYFHPAQALFRKGDLLIMSDGPHTIFSIDKQEPANDDSLTLLPLVASTEKRPESGT